MAVMRLSVTTMSPFSMTCVPCIVTRRAPFSTTVPRGLSFAAVIVTSYRCASYAIDGFFVVSRAAAAPPLVPAPAAAFVIESARATESRMATSAARTSYWK